MTAPDTNADIRRGIARGAGQMIAALVILGTILFLAAGRLNWAAGWAYLGLNAFTQMLSAIVLIRRQGEMLAERSQVRAGTKGWDRILTPAIVIVGTLAVLVTAGLDARFGWSGFLDVELWSAGIIVASLSQMFVLWAMASNSFFALTVHIQADRGQTVISSGPHRLVRHPMYTAALGISLGLVCLIQSWALFCVFCIYLVLILLLIPAEEEGLRQACGDQYVAYQRKTRKLIPLAY